MGFAQIYIQIENSDKRHNDSLTPCFAFILKTKTFDLVSIVPNFSPDTLMFNGCTLSTSWKSLCSSAVGVSYSGRFFFKLFVTTETWSSSSERGVCLSFSATSWFLFCPEHLTSFFAYPNTICSGCYKHGRCYQSLMVWKCAFAWDFGASEVHLKGSLFRKLWNLKWWNVKVRFYLLSRYVGLIL